VNMTTQRNPPQFDNKPVILVHFKVEAADVGYPPMYWCAPYLYIEDTEGSYPKIPRVPCPACAKAGI
jgi:hypothetical protein